jgi:hypothetical protein
MGVEVLIEHPPGYCSERLYIYDVMFRRFLGFDYHNKQGDRQNTRVTLVGDCGRRELILSDILFQNPLENWLTATSLPKQPLEWWKFSETLSDVTELSASRLPLVYRKVLENGTYYSESGGSVALGVDIFGSAFFMLTRYEEVVKPTRDQHDRFPATASLAYQEGFLEQPIVNEYLEILWSCMKRLWPRLERRRREYRLVLSHDVDFPLSVADERWPAALKIVAGDIVRRKDLSLAGRRLYSRICASFRRFDHDPHNTFDFIMNTSERHGLRSAFYFIADCSADVGGRRYSIDMPWIRDLMRCIHTRGHEIGLHPGYNTHCDASRTERELIKVRSAAEQEGITQDQWGGRQHYLQWKAPITWQNWEDAGLTYDSTLSFADHVGFRCGTCWEFPTFNLKTRKSLKLQERPLIVMEGTLLHYMRLSPEQCLDRIARLGAVCRAYSGSMTVLWHNSMLPQRWQKRLYEEAVEVVS